MGIPFLSSYIYRAIKPQTVADSVDCLNYYYTSCFLALAAFAISAKQYFGSPIQCWVPMEFRGIILGSIILVVFDNNFIFIGFMNFSISSGGWEKYTEDYCFIQNSYYVPFEEQIPDDVHARADQISYYRVNIFAISSINTKCKNSIVTCSSSEKIRPFLRLFRLFRFHFNWFLENRCFMILLISFK